MAVFKCKSCGAPLEIVPGVAVCECEYCGVTQTLPKLDTDKRTNLYDRAGHFRRNYDYDKAMGIYEQILNEDSTDAEAYWGVVLCRYGIEYVEDPATKKRMPTINRTQYTSILADEDYKSALQYASAEQRPVFEAEAKYIDGVQRGILEISRKEQPFDVFICYKETEDSGRRTRDSVLANDIYHQLTQEGLKVFYAKITLEDKVGEAYEPYIFAALNSAKVMVVLGTKPEYFKAVWVRNEWSRFLSLIGAGQKKVLIPCYRDMDPYDLPDEFSNLQAMDMSSIGFIPDLVRGIKKWTAKEPEKPAEKVVERVVEKAAAPAASSTAPLLRRAFMFLEDGDWNSANEYAEKVLDIEPENAKAYLAKLMAELRVRKEDNLKDQAQPYESRPLCQKVLRFADDKLKQKIAVDTKFINDRNEHNRQAGVFSNACSRLQSAKDEHECEAAAKVFASIPAFDGVKEKLQECAAKAENYRSRKYQAAQADMESGRYTSAQTAFAQLGSYMDSAAKSEECRIAILEKDYKEAQELKNGKKWVEAASAFAGLQGYKDSAKQAEECRQAKAAEECAEQAERERAEKEAKAKQTRMIAIIAAIIVIAAGAVYYITQIYIPTQNYNAAVALQQNGQYEEASAAFASLGDYKDAANRVFEPYYVQGRALREVGDWDGAVTAFKKANNYSDAEKQIGATFYAEGEAKRTKEDWEGAVTAFENAGSYGDAEKQIGLTYYLEGEVRRKARDWEGAIAAFKNAGSYSDSVTQIMETKYQYAKDLMAVSGYSKAVALFIEILGYKDVNSLLANDENLLQAYDQQFTKGNIVLFGSYPQTKYGTDNTEIEWIVLARKEKNVLLLSRYGLDVKPYNMEFKDVTWATCTIRSWLNKEFLNKAFTVNEQAGIAITKVSNGQEQCYNGWCTSENTEDRVFLLSYAEANQYFNVQCYEVSGADQNVESRLRPTDYAIAQGARVYDDYKTTDGSSSTSWLLRSSGVDQYEVSFVDTDGKLNAIGVHVTSLCVRPAFWLNIDELIN